MKIKSSSWIRRSAPMAAVLTGALCSVAPGAKAQDFPDVQDRPSRSTVAQRDVYARDDYHHDRDWDRHRTVRYRRYVSIPRYIRYEHRPEIVNAYSGRVWYGPHHHYHDVYRFPVVVNGVVTTRPYTYCNGALFYRDSRPLPRIALSASF